MNSRAETDDVDNLSARRSAVGDEVYEVLLTRLISLKIPPGARIGVDALVRSLGVSQTPIRAALIRLEAEGLVVKTHLIGYRAAPLPSRRQFEEIYQMRLLLEPFAAGKAATSMTDAQREELSDLANTMSAPSSEDAHVAYGKFAQLDARFHALIATSGGGRLLAETLERLHTHMHLFRFLFHSKVTEEAIKEHADVVSAVLKKKPELARTAMESHLHLSFERVAPMLDSLDNRSSVDETAVEQHP